MQHVDIYLLDQFNFVFSWFLPAAVRLFAMESFLSWEIWWVWWWRWLQSECYPVYPEGGSDAKS